MNRVIYVDVLLAVNWIVDYFLLVGTAAVTAVPASRRRLLAGAGAGSVSTLLFLAPPLPFLLQLAYQALTGAAVLYIAFALRRPRHFLKLCLWYFLLNLCYSGLVLAAMYWLSFSAVRQNNLTFYYDISPRLLVGCILLLYAALRLLLFLFEPPQTDRIVWARAQLPGGVLQAEVLIDSGFTAEDVLLDRPLLLLSWPDVSCRLPPGFADGLDAYFSQPQGRLPQGWHLVPLHTAAGELLAPGRALQLQINSRPARVTLAFCRERFREGQVQGLFGAKSYERMGNF